MSGTAYRLPFRGEPITVVNLFGHVVRARAAGFAIHNDEKRLRWRETKSKNHLGTLRIEDEGATWVRGWKGDRVTALRTVAMLRRANEEQERVASVGGASGMFDNLKKMTWSSK